MAIVDLSTEQIHGCKEGSRVWWHEQGHIVFNKTSLGAKINYYYIFFQMVAVFTIALSILINNFYLHLFAFINALGMVCSYLYEEVWCWVYSFKHYNK